MTDKTQTFSASRAGLGSVVVTDMATGKTQVVSNIGVVAAPAVTVSSQVFVIHGFP